jgi:hypothetical protein
VLALTAPASAEFTSQGEKGSGSGEFIEFHLEAGGATVRCGAFSEGASELAWTVTNGKEEVKKGSHLKFRTEKWGECTAEGPELSNGKATLTGCEFEVEEPKEEATLTAKVLKTCTVEASKCVITAEPKENEKLSSWKLYPSGEENHDSVLEPESENVVTKVNSECGSFGIEATSEGILTGAVQMRQVQPQVAGEFWLTTTREYFSAANPSGVLLVTYTAGAPAKPSSLTFVSHSAGGFTLNAANETTCRNQLYTTSVSCPIAIGYNWMAVADARADLLVAGPNNIGSIIIVRGT